MSSSIIWIGMDVHKDTVMVAVYVDGGQEPEVVQQLPNEGRKMRRFLDRWSRKGEIRSCYEASGAGYVLQREITGWGHGCEVVAPSLIPTRPGERRKHDQKDAIQLARLYRAGELVAVRIPSSAEERVRDLVRCRECFQREILRSRHYVTKFLARRGFVYREGRNWTQRHRVGSISSSREEISHPRIVRSSGNTSRCSTTRRADERIWTTRSKKSPSVQRTGQGWTAYGASAASTPSPP